jgi:glutamate-1-semialdehyde 2,1-aminomutase
MAAGLTMQTLNNDPAFFDRLAEKTAYLHKGIEAALKANNCILKQNWIYDFSSFYYCNRF